MKQAFRCPLKAVVERESNRLWWSWHVVKCVWWHDWRFWCNTRTSVQRGKYLEVASRAKTRRLLLYM